MLSVKSSALPLLAEFGQAALRGDNLADILNLAAQCAADGLRVTKVAILGRAPAPPSAIRNLAFVAQAWVGWDVSIIGPVAVDGCGQSPADQLIRDGYPMRLSASQDFDRNSWPDYLKSGGINEVLGASIGAGDDRYGVLEAGAEEIGHFTDNDKAFVAALASLLAAAFLRFPERLGEQGASVALLFDRPVSDQMETGIALLDHQGTILQSNAFYNECISGEVLSESYAGAKAFSGVGGGVPDKDILLRLVSGREIWVRLGDFPLPGHHHPLAASCRVITDITKWRAQKPAVLNPDLPHRIRNILSVIRVIARRTAERSESIEDYAAQLESRISALARVQTGMIADPDAGVDLGMLITDELLAHSIKGDRVTARGPRVKLWSKAAETLALAIHELTENAIKYGALSAKSGRIDISWAVDREENPSRLELEWSEFGVSVVGSAPRRQGFGHELIARTLPYELSAKTSIDFLPGGIRCAVAIPLVHRPPHASSPRSQSVWSQASQGEIS